MRQFKYICLILFLFLSFNLYVKAEDCDSNEIDYLKQLSKRITYQYDYVGYSVTDGDFQTYEVYFEALDNDFYVFIDDNDNNFLFEVNAQKNFIQSGKKGFKVYSKKCDVVVDYITINLPKFNEYSQSPFCEQNSDLEICDEWTEEEFTDKQFDNLVAEYNAASNGGIFDNLLNFVTGYYYYFIPIAILIIVLLILFIKKKIKDNRLD